MQPDAAVKILDSVDSMLGYWGTDLRCQFANPAYERWFGKPPRFIVGYSMKDLLGPLYELNLPYIHGTLAGKIQTFEREIPCPDGVVRSTLARYYPDISSGMVHGFSVQVTDVSYLKRLEAELRAEQVRVEQLASHDYQTGLPNRVLMVQKISSACSWALKNGEMVGVVSLDLDRFKTINDTFGHSFGDETLKRIAARMARSIRPTDTVMRMGGNEFVLIVSGLASREAIETVVLRLLQSISQPVSIGCRVVHPSFSCGVALFPSWAMNAKELLSCSDFALYEAQQMGGGQTVFAEQFGSDLLKWPNFGS